MAKSIDVLVTIPFSEAQQLQIREAAHGVRVKFAPARRVEDIPA